MTIRPSCISVQYSEAPAAGLESSKFYFRWAELISACEYCAELSGSSQGRRGGRRGGTATNASPGCHTALKYSGAEITRGGFLASLKKPEETFLKTLPGRSGRQPGRRR